MTHKPPNKTRQTLIDVGLLMLKENGIRNFSVRGLTERAGINPGSFVYHFGSREAFIEELTQLQYQPLMDKLSLKEQTYSNSLEKLKAMLLQFVDFIYDNSDFLSQLAVDLLNGEKLAQRFVVSILDKHPKILVETLQQAQRDNYLITANSWEMLFFIMAPLGSPIALMPSYKNQEILPEPTLLQIHQFLLKKQRAIQSIEWSLKGLSTNKES